MAAPNIEADRTFEALNHGTGWPHGKPRAVMIHSTRSGQDNRRSIAGHRLETRSTINWFQSPDSRASSNLIISPVEIVRMVSDDDYAWHAKEHSGWMWSIEVTQALATDPYLDGHYDLLARAGREYVRAGVPPVYLPHYSNGMEGFTGHEDSEQGVRDVKSDPGVGFDWDRFIAMIQEPQEDEDMVTLLRLGNGATPNLTWTPHTFVTDGFSLRHVTDPDDAEELYELGVWPNPLTAPLTSRGALEQLHGGPL